MLTRFTLLTLLALSAVPLIVVNAHNADCATAPYPHTYGPLPVLRGTQLSVAARVGGLVTVSDGNVADCDRDGIPADFDGDFEVGGSGAFFGAGPWANEPICRYGLKTHGTSVAVTDVLSTGITFVTGADDQSGPLVVTDPVTGTTVCETDGNISPGDPATNPTADPDDCMSSTQTSSGSACGTGGDGGYWVFLTACEWYYWPPPPGIECGPSATTGYITAA